MEYRRLGSSGLSVSALSIGSWMTWETMPEQDALTVIQKALDAGVTFLDDARYNDRTGQGRPTGYSEVLFGRLLRQVGRPRADLVIANKLWFEFFPAESIEAELDGSLSRLGMDYLDIVYCAEPPASLPLTDLVRELDRLVTSGKLRAWGVLNWRAEQIAQVVDVALANQWRLPAAAQLAYSVLSRSPVEDRGMVQVCRTANIGVVASYSLQGGLLTGKYQGVGVSAGGRLDTELATPRVQAMLPKLDAFVAIAHELACTPSQLALAYCLKNPAVSSLLFGARRVTQVDDNIGALDVLPRLADDVMAKLRRV